MRALLHQHSSNLLVLRELHFEFVGDVARDLLTTATSSIVGTHILEYIFSLDRIAFQDYLHALSPSESSCTIRLHNEQSVIFQGCAFPLDGEDLIVLRCLDPESHKDASNKLESERMETLGFIAAGVAHEINNPLTYLNLSIDELKQSLPVVRKEIQLLINRMTAVLPQQVDSLFENLNIICTPSRLEELEEAVEDSSTGADHIASIVSDLRMFSHLSHEERLVCISKSLRAAINLSKHRTKGKARLHIDISADLWVLADEGRLTQVLINLLVNAADAIPEGENGNIWIECTRVVDDVQISIRDDGNGIPLAVQHRLFDPFFTTKPSGSGSGLGLPISHQIIKEYGGDISFESREGEGTTFRVLIPVAGTNVEENTEELPVSFDQQFHRVLIVDDEEALTRQMQRSLSNHFDVRVANSGRLACIEIQQNPNVDLIISDLLMNDGSGKDIYKWLQRNHPNLLERLVFLTAGAHHPEYQHFLSSIPNLVFEKPIHTQEFFKIISKLMSSSKIDTKASDRRISHRLNARDINGQIFLGNAQHKVQVIDFSKNGLRTTGLPSNLSYRQHKYITVRLRNRKAMGEVSAHLNFRRYAERDTCFEINAMSDRDRRLYRVWLDLAG